MKKILIPIALSLALIAAALVIYPTVEFKSGGRFYALRYSDDISEFETELSADESYAYYEKEDISIHRYDIKKFLFFYVIKMEYIDGNYCDTQFLLEEEYMTAFLERAEITYNSADIDLGELLSDKTAVEGNIKYPGNEYDKQIDYILDGEYGTLFVYTSDDLLVIQVGFSDEGPRYIAYK